MRPIPIAILAALMLTLGAARADSPPDDGEQPRTRAVPQHAKDQCETADSNIARALDALGGGRSRAGAAVAHQPWRGGAPLKYLDRVDARLALTPAERALLKRNGFVVLDRQGFSTFAWAFHEIYISQLPVYISPDAILHAVFAVNDDLVADLEETQLAPLARGLLAKLHAALPRAADAYPAEVAQDLDLYLTVARRLMEEPGAAPALRSPATDRAAAELVASARTAATLATVEIFGRPRMVDFTQFQPRGHYAGRDGLKPFFRAAMWLSRLELNLVSRSSRSSAPGLAPDPRETPREVVLALALADLVERAGAGRDLARLERAWGLIAGRREDVSVADRAALRRQAGLIDLRRPDAAARLRAAIGARFPRAARIHYMPPGSTDLPAIATLLGPRIGADVGAVRPIVHAEVPARYMIGGADVAYLLGHDQARRLLAGDLKEFPSLGARLDRGRALMATPSAGEDLTSAWLAAARALAEEPRGVVPAFMQRPAFRDLRVGAAVAAYGQIKHNTVLMAGQAWDEGGCAIPDGWVEPAPAVYEHLLRYAERGARAWAELDPQDRSRGGAYFARLGRILRALLAIQRDELAGRALGDEARRLLSMVVEMAPGSSGGPPTYTGWYFDLFRRREADGLRRADFIADVYTSSNRGIAYLGANGPRLGLFVVDAGGPPRVMVGPVADAYEHHGPLARRLDDEAARALPAAARARPWAATYLAAAPPEPPLALRYVLEGGEPRDRVTVASTARLGRVTVDLMDHHRNVLRSQTLPVGPGAPVAFRFQAPAKVLEAVRALRVRVGAFSYFEELEKAGGVLSIDTRLGTMRPKEEAPAP